MVCERLLMRSASKIRPHRTPVHARQHAADAVASAVSRVTPDRAARREPAEVGEPRGGYRTAAFGPAHRDEWTVARGGVLAKMLWRRGGGGFGGGIETGHSGEPEPTLIFSVVSSGAGAHCANPIPPHCLFGGWQSSRALAAPCAESHRVREETRVMRASEWTTAQSPGNGWGWRRTRGGTGGCIAHAPSTRRGAEGDRERPRQKRNASYQSARGDKTTPRAVGARARWSAHERGRRAAKGGPPSGAAVGTPKRKGERHMPAARPQTWQTWVDRPLGPSSTTKGLESPARPNPAIVDGTPSNSMAFPTKAFVRTVVWNRTRRARTARTACVVGTLARRLTSPFAPSSTATRLVGMRESRARRGGACVSDCRQRRQKDCDDRLLTKYNPNWEVTKKKREK